MIFGNSTFICFLPKELDEYMKVFVERGVKEIVVRDPFWGGYEQENNANAYSRHLEGGCWFHNYAGYFRKYDYRVAEFVVEDTPTRSRPDCKSILIRGIRG